MPKYPREFRKEIWDPPEWVLSPGVTLTSGRAAAFLGIANRHILVSRADDYGLTVIRRGRNKRIYFLRSELIALRDAMGKVTAQDVIRVKEKGGQYAVLE